MFLFDKFAQYLKNEYHIVRINGQLHIYNDGVYDYANKTIESKMIEKIPSLKAQQRTEVLKYLECYSTADVDWCCLKRND